MVTPSSHWVFKDTFVLRSLCFFGTPFELSQSNLSCVVCPEDPELLAASRDPGPVLNVHLEIKKKKKKKSKRKPEK